MLVLPLLQLTVCLALSPCNTALQVSPLLQLAPYKLIRTAHSGLHVPRAASGYTLATGLEAELLWQQA